MENLSSKAQTIVDTLPYLRLLKDTTIVIKYGGSVMEEAVYADSILQDVAFLHFLGVKVILVHGGGKAISNKMRESGITPKFVNGLRFTDKKTVSIVEQVLHKVINPQIVNALKQRDAPAVQIPGKKVLKGKKLLITGSQGEKIDLGFVGDITGANKAPIIAALKKNLIPVITPLATGPGGSTLNVNADIAASKIAIELKAHHLVFLSDTNGILEDHQNPESTIVQMSEAEIEGLRTTGVINGGMLPKVNASIEALKKGVKRVKLLNGQLAHTILIDLLLPNKVGTRIVL